MMGLAGVAALLYTRGEVTTLVVMYSINVFITFSLSLLGMSKHWIQERNRERRWLRRLAIHGVGFVMCASILIVTIFEKFRQGGWITVVITGALIAVAFSIHKHYARVRAELVPEYLQRLGRESALAGQRFDELTIERDAENGEVVFNATSSAAQPAEIVASDRR